MQTNNSVNSSNRVKPDEFRVGDTVWCVLYGEGKVTDIFEDCDFPVEVTFPEKKMVLYTADGQYTTGANRTLFFSEPKIEASVNRPFVPTLVGKMVVVLEYACYPQVFVVTWENVSMFGNDKYKCVKSNSKVYEVSSENLLKP